jgi:uncharacterized protein YjaG (DUF416 family)
MSTKPTTKIADTAFKSAVKVTDYIASSGNMDKFVNTIQDMEERGVFNYYSLMNVCKATNTKLKGDSSEKDDDKNRKFTKTLTSTMSSMKDPSLAKKHEDAERFVQKYIKEYDIAENYDMQAKLYMAKLNGYDTDKKFSLLLAGMKKR